MKHLTFILLTAIFNFTYGSHVYGGWINVKHVNNQNYIVQINIINNCNITFGTLTTGMFFSTTPTTGLGGASYQVKLLNTTNKLITWLCKSQTPVTSCTGNSSTIESHQVTTFDYTINFNDSTISKNNNDYYKFLHFSASLCCRGSGNNGAGEDFYFSTAIRVEYKNGFYFPVKNSTPKYEMITPAEICLNKPAKLYFGASDTAESDSIKYQLVPTQKSFNTDAIYASPWNYKFPLTPYCPNPGTLNCTPVPTSKPPRGFYLDSNTGMVIFTPTKMNEIGFIGVRIIEYRKIKGAFEIISITNLERIASVLDNCGFNNAPVIEEKPLPYNIVEFNSQHKMYWQGIDSPYRPKQISLDSTFLKHYYTPNFSQINSFFEGKFNHSKVNFTASKSVVNKTYTIVTTVFDDFCRYKLYDIDVCKVKIKYPATRYNITVFEDKNKNCSFDNGEKILPNIGFFRTNSMLTFNRIERTSNSGKFTFKLGRGEEFLKVLPTEIYSQNCGMNAFSDIGDTVISVQIPLNLKSNLEGKIAADMNKDCSVSVSDSVLKYGNVCYGKNCVGIINGNFNLYFEDSSKQALTVKNDNQTTYCNNKIIFSLIKPIKDSSIKVNPIATKSKKDLQIFGYSKQVNTGFEVSIILKNLGNVDIPSSKLKLIYIPKYSFINNSVKYLSIDSIRNFVIDYKTDLLKPNSSQNISILFRIKLDSIENSNDRFEVHMDTSFIDDNSQNNSSYISIINNNSLIFSKKVLKELHSTAELNCQLNISNYTKDTIRKFYIVDYLDPNFNYKNIEATNASVPFKIWVKNYNVIFECNNILIPPFSKDKKNSQQFINYSVPFFTNNLRTINGDLRAEIYINDTSYLRTEFYTYKSKNMFTEIVLYKKKNVYCPLDTIIISANYNHSSPSLVKLEICDSADNFKNPVTISQWKQYAIYSKLNLPVFVKSMPNPWTSVKMRLVSNIDSAYYYDTLPFVIKKQPKINLFKNVNPTCESDSIAITTTQNNTNIFNNNFNYIVKNPSVFKPDKVKKNSVIFFKYNHEQNACPIYDTLKPTIINGLPSNIERINDTICSTAPLFVKCIDNSKFTIFIDNLKAYSDIDAGVYPINISTGIEKVLVETHKLGFCIKDTILPIPIIEKSIIANIKLEKDTICRNENAVLLVPNEIKKTFYFLDILDSSTNKKIILYNKFPINKIILITAFTSRGCENKKSISFPYIRYNDVQLNTSKNYICSGDTMSFIIKNNSESNVYLNNNFIGKYTDNVKVFPNLFIGSNNIQILKVNNSYCKNPIFETTIFNYGTIVKPVITQVSNQLCSNYPFYNSWYVFPDSLQTVDTNKCINFSGPNVYKVKYSVNSTSCSASSAWFNVLHLEPIKNHKILIIPNPANTYIVIKNAESNGEIKLFNTLGKLIMMNKLTNHSINIKHLPIGVYYVQLIQNGKIFIGTFIKN